ncbi:MAG: GMC oxidoreductase [Hyphomicrobiaceae bacterium]
MARRLSRHVSAFPPAMADGGYDAIVIGSGYGGGIAASRLARSGLKVCVLERGREMLPGAFPDRLSEAAAETQISLGDKHIGRADALFDLRVGDDIHVLQGCGLGGTSLINANVCLKPDMRVFDDPVWPEALRSDGLLAEGFARARQMLQPETCPPTPAQAKLDALGTAARHLGAELKRPPLHIKFETGPNAANVVQPACTFCGDCCGGCNVGAKTTTLNTYLADATAFGAHLYTGARVVSVAKANDGSWVVRCTAMPDGEKEAESGVAHLRTKIVVLAAGTLGTNEILLRSRQDGLSLSDRLGHGFTSNGDALATAYNNDCVVNGVGVGHPYRADVPPVGPAVAGLIDLRGTEQPDDGTAIVEAALPSMLAPLLPASLVPGGALFGEAEDRALGDQLDGIGRAFKSLVTGAYRGALHNTQSFLAIGHDQANGRMVLENDRVVVTWPGAADQEVFQKIGAQFAAAAAATGGTYIPNPMSHPMMGHALTTVHPLGGCAMGENAETGVVNHACEVFDGSGTATHDGLYVCDGSVMPRSLGIHPLMTISAVAERAMLLFARIRQYDVDMNLREGEPTAPLVAPPAAKPAPLPTSDRRVEG